MHKSSSSAPAALMIWWTCLAKALIGQCVTLIACRWIVCPILQFFWLVIFSIAAVADSSVLSGAVRERSSPSL
eukprot:8249105-Ditylum_brightwellii.AAC.1